MFSISDFINFIVSVVMVKLSNPPCYRFCGDSKTTNRLGGGISVHNIEDFLLNFNFLLKNNQLSSKEKIIFDFPRSL